MIRANDSGTQQCAIPLPTVAERLEVFLIDYIIDPVILTIKYIKTLAGNEAEKTKRLLVFLLPVILLSVGINFPRFFEVIVVHLIPTGCDVGPKEPGTLKTPVKL